MTTPIIRTRHILLWVAAMTATVPLIAQSAESLSLEKAAPRSSADAEERLQLGQYKAEEPLKEYWHNATVQKIEWRDGDLEVLFTQTAPCGWMPVNPNWQVNGLNVMLNFIWMPRRTDRPVVLTGLCKEYVRAWVFRVPTGEYRVTLGEMGGRFVQRNGKIVLFTGPS